MGGTHLIRESRTDGRTLFGKSSVSLDPTEPADNVGAGVRVVVVWLGLSVAQVAEHSFLQLHQFPLLRLSSSPSSSILLLNNFLL